MQYDSRCQHVYSDACSSCSAECNNDSLGSGVGDMNPKVNAPVPVPNTQQHSVYTTDLSIGSFSVRLVNAYSYDKFDSKKSMADKESIVISALNNSWFSTKIIETTRAFSKTTNYTREFGFLPLDRYVIRIGCGTKSLLAEDMKSWVREAHAVVKNTRSPNYMKACVTVPSGLCIDKWHMYLQHYDLKIVCEYLQFGFPVNVDYNLFTYVEEVVYHPSAIAKMEGVDKYFQDELGYGAIVGLFNSKPFEKLHISPLMARTKPDGGTRVIVDLSWPRHCSVNSCVPTNCFDFIEFQLKYPTIDNLICKIKEMGPTALMFKVDLQRAFRNLPMDPADYPVLGLHWQNQTYLDVATAFRFRQGAASCQLCTDAVTYLMCTQNIWVMAYLDDIIGIASPVTANGAFLTLKNLLENLGLPINHKKVTSPSSQITCLGININAATRVLSIPDEKLEKIRCLCVNWASKQKATRNQIQKLLGHLLYLHKFIPPARLFTNRILAVLRGCPKAGYITLTEAFHKDVAWFNHFLESFNGSVKIHDSNSVNNVVYVDPSLVALGAIFNKKVYTLHIPQILKTFYSIVHFEAVNILVILRTWGKYMKNQRCTVYCDNMAVVNTYTCHKI